MDNSGIAARFYRDDDGKLVLSSESEVTFPAIAGEDFENDRLVTEQRWQYVFKEADSDAAVSATSGVLHSIVFGDVNGGGYLILKDSADASGDTMLVVVPSSTMREFTFDIPFDSGLFIDVNNTNGAQPMKFIVTFRENS